MVERKEKVFITDCDHENIDIENALFVKASIPFKLKKCKTENEVIEQCQGATVLVNQYAELTEKVFEQLPTLKMVVRYGVGVNNIDVEAASNHSVQVCNVPDYGTNEVADHALAMMLNFTRKIGLMNQSVKDGKWQYEESVPIIRHSEQIIGIIGIGRIGTAFAEKVHALGCKILAYDSKKEIEHLPSYIQRVNLDILLEQSDVVSIHCPLENAYHLINEQSLRNMKSTSYLINVSRGGIIDEGALEKALKEGWIAGAAMDVAEKEPLDKKSDLLKYNNFVCTPHMAWYSEHSAVELKRKVSEEVIRFLNGEKVHYPLN